DVGEAQRRVVSQGRVDQALGVVRDVVRLLGPRLRDDLLVDDRDLVLVVEGEGEVQAGRRGAHGREGRGNLHLVALLLREGPVTAAVDRGVGPDAGDAVEDVLLALHRRALAAPYRGAVQDHVVR